MTEKIFMSSLYPQQISEYWDYDKNNQLKVYPTEVTKGSHKRVWLRCPIDNRQWKTNILRIHRSWKVGNNGCACCAQKNNMLKIKLKRESALLNSHK